MQKYDLISDFSAVEKNHHPIIFLHGLADNRKTWKRVAPVISRKTSRKAYVPDARNHGENPWCDEKMNYDTLTQDLLDFMNEHGIEKAVIVGHSMGGRTAINFALKHPDRVEILVVEDMTPKNVSTKKFDLVRLVIRTARDFLDSLPPDMDLDAAKKLILNGLTSLATDKFTDKERVKMYDLDMIPIKKVGSTFMSESNLDAAMYMVNSDSLVQNLTEKNLIFNGDALFLYGSRPFFNLGRDSSIKTLFPRAIVKQIEGASHYIHLDFPDTYADLVSDFILHRNIPNSKY